MRNIKNLNAHVRQWTEEEIDRRTLLKRAAVVGISAPVIGSLIAACADDDDDDDVVDDPVDVSDDEEEDEPIVEDDDDVMEEDDEDVADVPDDDRYGGEVHLSFGSGPRTLLPPFSTSGREIQLYPMIYGSLVKINDGAEAIPELAESIEASEDATSYTFVLFENLIFNDGEPLTSDDVRFSFEIAIIPETGSVWRTRFMDIVGAEEFSDGETDQVEGIVTPDDRTIEFQLVEPNAVFLMTIANTGGYGILPRHILGDVAPEDLADHEFSRAPTVTSGAFDFVRWETDQFMEFERSENYHLEGLPYLDRFFYVNTTPATAVAQVETGELDWALIPYEELERMEGLDHVTVHSVPSTTLVKLTINLNRPYFQDVRVRQAMMYAIDRPALVEAAVLGHGTVTNTPFVAVDWLQNIEGLNDYPYDPDRARELLDEAGWDTSQQIEIMHEADTAPWWITTLTIIQELWREVGIQVDLAPVDTAELNIRTIDTDDFDFRPLSGAGGDPDHYALFLTTGAIPPAGSNYSRYSNEEVDELFRQGRASGAIEDRLEIYSQIARILNEELPELYLYNPNNLSAYNNRIQGALPPAFRDNTVWNLQEWWVTND